MLSVCFCCWNDLPYVQLLLNSIKKYAIVPNEIIIVDNGSTDGTSEWVSKNYPSVRIIKLGKNYGATAVIEAIKLAKFDCVLNINADMIIMPGSVPIMFNATKNINRKYDKFLVSALLIEPQLSIEPQYIFFDAGKTAKEFNEKLLLSWYRNVCAKLRIKNHIQYSHPLMAKKQTFIDAYKNIGFGDTPGGVGSDHCIPTELYNQGYKRFIRLGNCFFYHFSCKTIGKLGIKFDFDGYYEKKYGETLSDFRKKLGLWRDIEI